MADTKRARIDPLEKLNDAQRAAVLHRAGPLRIIAGAGAGKTHTLTRSVIHLVQEGLARPDQILALTFTRKAAGELKERMTEAIRAIDETALDVDVDTYNAFGGRIVAEHGHASGYPPDPTILTQSDAWITLWRSLDRVAFETMDWAFPRGFGQNRGPLGKIIGFGNRLQDERRRTSDLRAMLELLEHEDDSDLGDMVRVIDVYEERKRDLGAIDYGDQITVACDLLEHESVRQTYAERYRYIMVDEFQDTNFAQRVMVRGLGTAVDGNIRVVGDPNQAIYRFRGAAPDNLERFISEDFPDAITIELNLNYRSTNQILRVANTLWDAEPGPFRGQLEAADGKIGPPPMLVSCAGLHDEAAWIAGKIGELVASGLARSDIAILVRKNDPKRQLHRALTALGVPIELVGTSSLYEQPEIRLLISALRVIAGVPDDTALAHLLSSDRWGIDEASLYQIGLDRDKGEPLLEACRRLALAPATPAAHMVAECMHSLERLSEFAYTSPLSQLVDRVAQSLLGALDSVPAANVARFRNVVRDFAAGQIDPPTLTELLVYIDLLLSSDPDDEAAPDFTVSDRETVKMMTVHAAKGLEWPIVFVATANANDFATNRKNPDLLTPELVRHSQGRPERADFDHGPGGRAAFVAAVREWEGAEATREARRLLYVALTRAQQQLYLTWSAQSPARKTSVGLLPMVAELAACCDCIEPDPIPKPSATQSMESFARRALPPIAHYLDDITGDQESLTNATALIAGEWEAIGGDASQLPHAFATFTERRQAIRRDLDMLRAIEARQEEFEKTESAAEQVITYSALETWRACPHRYYLRYSVGLPGMPGRIAAAYGASVHELIQRDGEARMEGKPGGIPEHQPPPVPVAPVVANGGNRAGTCDPVTSYLASIDARLTPILTEAEFAFRLGDIAVQGVIDRVHRLPDGSIEVVDYKTDRALRSAATIRDGLQLPLYLIGVRRAFPEIQPAPNRATMFFLRWNHRESIVFGDEELAEAERRIIDYAGQMRSVTAEAHKASAATCATCEYRLSCRYAVRTPVEADPTSAG